MCRTPPALGLLLAVLLGLGLVLLLLLSLQLLLLVALFVASGIRKVGVNAANELDGVHGERSARGSAAASCGLGSQ